MRTPAPRTSEDACALGVAQELASGSEIAPELWVGRAGEDTRDVGAQSSLSAPIRRAARSMWRPAVGNG